MPDKTFLDWPFLDDHHRALAQDLDHWAQKELTFLDRPHEDLDGLCAEVLSRLAAGGWLKYTVPAAYGGIHQDLDVRSLCLIRETLARYSGLADFVFAMQGLGSGTLSLCTDEALKRHYLPKVAKGATVAAFALTEPDAGSDVAAMTTSATRDGETYVINGTKTFISNGGIADFYTLFARTGDAPGAKGISAFVVDAETPGLEITERIQVIAPHPLATLTFKDCRIPKENLIGDQGSGFKAAMSTLDVFRSTVGAAALGLARRALEEARARAANRKIFDGILSDLQIIQSMIGEMALDVDASALLVYRSAWTKDVQKTRVTREAAMAKLYATDHAQQVIDKAVQIFGGLGVVSGVKVEELYREIRALRIYEGASEVQKIIIARQAMSGD